MKPAFAAIDMAVMVRQSLAIYNLFFYVNADDHRKKDPNWKPAYSAALLPLIRSMIDALYNITVILDDPGPKGYEFRESGFKLALVALDADEKRYGSDPRWSEYITKMRKGIDAGMVESGITMDELVSRRGVCRRVRWDRRLLSLFQPALQAVRFFQPSAFYTEFFGHFGPQNFMGFPLQGAHWLPVYYAAVMLVCNIGGEELWWRGYVLPRQELAFGRMAWIVHGLSWSLFHLFVQPTLWDTTRMAITGLALSFVAQRTRSTWPGIVGHTFGNLPLFLNLDAGVRPH